jgi:hypothetical protein
MLSADYCTGILDWNTCRVNAHKVRPMKSAPSKDERKHVADEMGLMKPKLKNSVADLDVLVSSMETSDVLPDSSSARGSGISARGSTRKPVKPSKSRVKESSGSPEREEIGHYTDRDRTFDRIAAKYNIPSEVPLQTDTKRSSRHGRKGIIL